MSEGFDDSFVGFEDSVNSLNENPSTEHLPDSTVYLQKLEKKLKRLKNGNKEPKPKDMLSVLEKVREHQMSRLNMSSDPTTFLPEMDINDREMSISYLERKLFPQKNALTYEELQHLLEADVLAKLATENGTVPDKSVDR